MKIKKTKKTSYTTANNTAKTKAKKQLNKKLHISIIRLAHCKYKSHLYSRRVCPTSDLKNKAIGTKFCRLHKKSESPSKNMMSDFAPEIAKYPKSSSKPQKTQNGDLDN